MTLGISAVLQTRPDTQSPVTRPVHLYPLTLPPPLTITRPRPGSTTTQSTFRLVMEKFSSVRFSTLNLRTPNQTIRSIRQFSRTLNGTWRSGSKSVQFTFERSLNANVSELGSTGGPPGVRAPVWHGGRRRRDSLVGVLRAVPMDLQPRQGVGGHGHARRGGELARGWEERHASRCQGAAGRARGSACSGARQLRILAGHQRGAGARARGRIAHKLRTFVRYDSKRTLCTNALLVATHSIRNFHTAS